MPSGDDMKAVGEFLGRNKVDVSNLAFRCVESSGSGGTGSGGLYVGSQRLSDIITEEQAQSIYLRVSKEQGLPPKNALFCSQFILYGSRYCWVICPSMNN